ncbi:hypothetical protein BH11PSE5_BH11PSE5_31870 [soil metagenome]|jgi:hypothetical protein|uniref:DUF3572 domain-containing protein n=1 Tax=unclassified Sphingobium TaxID=2611147 RepID=UPI001E54A1CB|nr:MULTISPECIES: DUF3572 domain-containing protein [unclassified Sphingobium]GLI97181.1 hypothetical protein Sbs19_09990 [Sphingobium sp. BS19]CAH0352071.1 hypothetical protein SPH9361_01794 [Sphingobium sp. CECT 9361]
MPPSDMESKNSAPDPQTLALQALVWMLSDTRRADRLLAITGLDADALRAGIGDPLILSAVLDHLANYEPDLIACADAIDCKPTALIHAHKALTA